MKNYTAYLCGYENYYTYEVVTKILDIYTHLEKINNEQIDVKIKDNVLFKNSDPNLFFSIARRPSVFSEFMYLSLYRNQIL